MWNRTKINLGTIKAKVKKKVTFSWIDEPGKEFKMSKHSNGEWFILTQCNCTLAEWDPKTKTLTVEYTPNEVPIHLIQAKKYHYNALKTVTVNYTINGTPHKEILFFSAVVKNKL